jgi:hypothetical protein
MTHNRAAVDLLASRLASGLIHPGDPDGNQPPIALLLPGLSSTGIPGEMAKDFADEAGLPANDTPRLIAEAIVYLLETELAGGSTIIADADLNQLRQSAADVDDARIVSVYCHCDTANPLLQLPVTHSDRIVVNGATLIDGLSCRDMTCPHRVNA